MEVMTSITSAAALAPQHLPVMVAEVLSLLRPQDGTRFLDGTLGGGGHAVAVLETSTSNSSLLGLDRDAHALAAAEGRLAPFAGRVLVRHASFSAASEQ